MKMLAINDVAELLNVKPNTVAHWRHRGLMPEPTLMVGNRPAWELGVIEAWRKAEGYPRKPGKQPQPAARTPRSRKTKS